MSETVLLQMKNIHKSFPGVKALQGVDLELRAGEVHALLGENGAGKSTLIKVLGGIYIAEEGEIFIDGKKVTIDGVNASHNNGISIIHQELVLVPHMTVAENIFLGREPSKGLWVSHETMEKEAQQLLDTYHMSIDAGTLVKDLTIAQQQMVEIVKAISYRSRILVMDEPTRGVDVGAKSEIYAIMNELVKKGVSIIMISSELPEILNMSDRVYVMCDGRITGCFSHEECVTQEQIMKLAAK